MKVFDYRTMNPTRTTRVLFSSGSYRSDLHKRPQLPLCHHWLSLSVSDNRNTDGIRFSSVARYNLKPRVSYERGIFIGKEDQFNGGTQKRETSRNSPDVVYNKRQIFFFFFSTIVYNDDRVLLNRDDFYFYFLYILAFVNY